MAAILLNAKAPQTNHDREGLRGGLRRQVRPPPGTLLVV